MQHQLDIHYKTGMKDLTEDLGDLRYDALEIFLQLFYEKMERDAEADRKRGRLKLAESLQEVAYSLAKAKEHVARAWRISKPYMKDDGSC